MNREKILIIDDEPDISSVIADILSDEGFQIDTACDANEGHQKYLSFNPDIILLDIWMPSSDGKISSGNEGLKLLEKWQSENLLSQPVIMISGHGNVETAVEAVKKGAYDFLEKPLSTSALLLTIERAIETENLKKENEQLKLESNQQRELIGNSAAIKEIRRQITLLGPTNSWVFLSGEVGTGKNIVAQSLHAKSNRTGAFVQLNLAATPSENVATQLFGIEFNGTEQMGCFEEAHLGTLFINEVLDIDFETQGKLLSALQEQRLLRVDGKKFIDFDVRVVSATNGDIEEAVRKGDFREDLYFRLNVVPIRIPSLRDRKDDIEAMLLFHIERLAKRNNLKPRTFSADALQAMCDFHWPGNVRQLINVVNRLQLLNPNTIITKEEFLSSVDKEIGLQTSEPLTIPNYFELSMRDARDSFESLYLQYQLNKANNNMTQLAQNIGMERTHIYRKLKSLGIETKK